MSEVLHIFPETNEELERIQSELDSTEGWGAEAYTPENITNLDEPTREYIGMKLAEHVSGIHDNDAA